MSHAVFVSRMALPRIAKSSVAAAVVLLTTLLPAQANNTSLAGRVTDPSGLAIPYATIHLTSRATGVALRAESNEQGLYSFPFLSPGEYRINVSARGFRAFEQETVIIATGERTVLDARLELGELADAVTVQDEVTAVNTVDGTRGNPFNTRSILQLPLEGRNVAGLLSLQSGVTSLTDDPKSRDIRNGSVNGAQVNQSNITLDGVDINDQETKYPFNGALRTTLDSVQEFRVVTTNANADMGRSSGAQVSLVTKGGGNAFHGSLYEFHRNNATAANDFFNNRAGVEKPKLIRNVFGGAVGGPIVRNRAFFFFNYEGRRDASDSTEVRSVPTENMRNGVIRYLNTSGGISELSVNQLRAMDPLGIGPSPQVLEYMRGYPVANDNSVGDSINTSGYRFTARTPLSWNTSIARIDWNLGSAAKHQMFLRGNLQADTQQSAPQFPGQVPNTVTTGNNKGLAFGYTVALNPNLISTFRYGLTRAGSADQGIMTQSRADLFMVADPLLGVTSSLSRVMPVHTITEDLAWNHGKHSLQFGGVFRSIRNRRVTNENSFSEVWGDSNTLLDGNTLRMPDLSELWVQPFESSVMSLMGIQNFGQARYNYLVDGTLLPDGSSVNRNFGMEEAELYIHDTWRVTRGLTISAGLRWSLMPPVREINGAQVSMFPNYSNWVNSRVAMADAGRSQLDAGLISFVARDSAQGEPIYPFYKNNFAPRISFAYSPQNTDGWKRKIFGGAGKTVIRGGGGLFYDLFGMEIMQAMDTTAFGLSSAISTAPLGMSLATASRYSGIYNMPDFLPGPPPGGPGVPPETFGYAEVVDSRVRAPYALNLDFSVAREIGRGFTLEVGYVGRLARRALALENSGAAQVNFRDPQSGERLFPALRELQTQVYQNTAVDNVRPIAFWENMFPGAAGNGRTATQSVYEVVQLYSPDPTSALYALDIECEPTCSRLGAYTFFTPQYSYLQAARNISRTDYHSMQVTMRKRFTSGYQFDFNYTWSKTMDMTSIWGGRGAGAEGYSTWIVTNPWDRNSQRAVADYDMRHQFNANWVAELPFGKGKRFGTNTPAVVDAIAGGWQLSGLFRLTSGLPISVLNVRGWPNGWCCPHYGEVVGVVPAQTNNRNAPLIGGGGGPNLFDDPLTALSSFGPANVGPTSNRNNLRGEGVFTIDFGLSKRFTLPFEGHSIQIRAEAFNLTNTVRFRPDLFGTAALEDPGSFGNYNTVMTPARVMQFGLRYEF